MRKTIAVHIYGKVQNVGFRYYTRKTASVLGITGYVKNLPDGSVYAEATGEDNLLETFTQWCKQGPSWARVEQIHVTPLPNHEYNDFIVL